MELCEFSGAAGPWEGIRQGFILNRGTLRTGRKAWTWYSPSFLYFYSISIVALATWCEEAAQSNRCATHAILEHTQLPEPWVSLHVILATSTLYMPEHTLLGV